MTDQRPPAAGDAAKADAATGVVTKTSPRSVSETVARLESLAEAKGLKLFAVIDHSGEAEKAGLALRDTKVVIFGSPQAGTPVMQAVPLTALDLPLKVLVWSDGGTDTDRLHRAGSARRPLWPQRGAGSAASRYRRPHRCPRRRVTSARIRASPT